jgi:hypothetical protein
LVYERREVGQLHGKAVKWAEKHHFAGHILPGTLLVYEQVEKEKK